MRAQAYRSNRVGTDFRPWEAHGCRQGPLAGSRRCFRSSCKPEILGLDSVIPSLKFPVLGICVGMQVMCRHSEEGDVAGLGIFGTDVVRFRSDDPSVKIPHMGWNSLTVLKSPLFKGLREGSFMYFVHSFYAGICDCTVAASEHSVKFSAALCKDNFYGTQFHPEKSGMGGAALLKYFLIVTRTPCLSWPDLTDRPATAEPCHVLIHLPRRDSSVVLNK